LPGVYSSQYGRGMGITVSTELSRDQSEEAKPTKTKPTKNQNKDLTFMGEHHYTSTNPCNLAVIARVCCWVSVVVRGVQYEAERGQAVD